MRTHGAAILGGMGGTSWSGAWVLFLTGKAISLDHLTWTLGICRNALCHCSLLSFPGRYCTPVREVIPKASPLVHTTPKRIFGSRVLGSETRGRAAPSF